MLTNPIDESHKNAKPDEHNFIIHIFLFSNNYFIKFFLLRWFTRAPSIGLKYC